MLYLIKRGPQPNHYRAPFHPVILCTHRFVAKSEVGPSSSRGWMWVRDSAADRSDGWLLTRWEGLDIDYWPVVHTFTLPDGTTRAAYWRDFEAGLQDLLRGAVWWSTKPLPAWLATRGVIYPPDRYSRDEVLEAEHEELPRTAKRQAQWPAWWPALQEGGEQ